MPPHIALGETSLDRVELEVWWKSGQVVRTYTLDAYRPHVIMAEDVVPGRTK